MTSVISKQTASKLNAQAERREKIREADCKLAANFDIRKKNLMRETNEPYISNERISG